jgi:outer membrane protein assembly factor BamB
MQLGFISIVCLALAMPGLVSASTNGGGLGGDLLLSMANGDVRVHQSADGAYVRSLASETTGKGLAMGFDAYMHLYVPHWYADDRLLGNRVERFDADGNLQGTFGGVFNGSEYDCNPSSIDFDFFGNAYVGQADCSGDVIKLDAFGNVIRRFRVAAETRGSIYLDLAADNCTLYYTSMGARVKRFNLCLNRQLPDFATVPQAEDGGAQTVKILANGGVLVANNSVVVRFDARGRQKVVYDAAGENCFNGLALDPDGRTFWTSSICNAMVYRFNLATGAILANYSIGTGSFSVNNVIVAPKARRPAGGMSGSALAFSTAPALVKYEFCLPCDAKNPKAELEIAWGDNRFSLQSLSRAACSDDPSVPSSDNGARFNTLRALGTGSYNGQDGATIQLVFTDTGRSSRFDGAYIVIRDSNKQVVLEAFGIVAGGKHTANRG